MDESESQEPQSIELETPPDDVFIAPSIDKAQVLLGNSYTHHSAIPPSIASDLSTECVLGVDEAGRGPVLGPMVYALYYLPLSMHRSLLADAHHFDDSKALTPAVRSHLMEKVCTPETDLYQNSGWATRIMSARDISSAQLRPNGVYNLNAQAMDATVALIQEVLDSGVNVREIYIDTIGPPAAYQKKLERIFPAVSITVAKKADSFIPVYQLHLSVRNSEEGEVAWGSGYPSDARCTNWMKANMDPLFGWGNECRFSWGTAKEMLEVKGAPCKVDWPEPDDGAGDMKLTGFLMGAQEEGGDELSTWFGRRVPEEVF